MRMRHGLLTMAGLGLGLAACGSSSGSAASTDAGVGLETGAGDGAPVESGLAPDGGIPDTGGAGDGGNHPVDAGGDAGAVKGTTVGSFLGVNALITDAVAKIAPIGVAREYHNWGWLGNNYNDQP